MKKETTAMHLNGRKHLLAYFFQNSTLKVAGSIFEKKLSPLTFDREVFLKIKVCKGRT